MPKLNREKTGALGALIAVILAACIVPVLLLQARSNALDDLEDRQNTRAHLEAAHLRAGKKTGADRFSAAPAAAFVNAQTPGLASAQLEAYLSQLVLSQGASLTSSAVQPVTRADPPETVRIQATVDINYEALQPLLYRLEMGTPYVFVDSMKLQAPNAARQQGGGSPNMKVVLNLRALWHPIQP